MRLRFLEARRCIGSGSKPHTPSEHPNPTTKIGPKMGEFTYHQNGIPLVLTHGCIGSAKVAKGAEVKRRQAAEGNEACKALYAWCPLRANRWPWQMMRPPGKPGIGIDFSTRTTRKDTYACMTYPVFPTAVKGWGSLRMDSRATNSGVPDSYLMPHVASGPARKNGGSSIGWLTIWLWVTPSEHPNP